MSNPVRFDPLLVRALAAELGARLAGRAAAALPVFDADRAVVLPLDRGEALRWELHPARGWVSIVPHDAPGERPARVARVTAPPDERLLRIALHEGTRFRGARRWLVFELHGNQWNALVVDGESRRIVSVLRAREAGSRALAAGAEYVPPAPTGRLAPDGDGARAAWRTTLGGLTGAERRTALVRAFAWTSPLCAETILGPQEEDDAGLDAAFERWRRMADGEGAGAFLLRGPAGAQPYPFPLDGWEAAARPALLDAFATLASEPGTDAAAAEAAALLARARKRHEAAARRVGSLEAELAKAGEAERLRGLGDLILAHLHLLRPGMERVSLPAFDGGVEAEVALDPALRPHENAERYYADARRRARAEARVPALIAAAEAERDRWAAAVAGIEAGDVPAWAAAALARAPAAADRKPSAPAERLPYRAYRTSGGLEVRVGKTSRDNDRLTFHHASPGDVWLHARSVPGSHVVLRWTSPDAPPARDLEEAAVLAALYSKARTSGTVAVDWTRRRHVRKPRGAPPGRVSLLHAKTVFVAPDPAVEERLTEREVLRQESRRGAEGN